METGKNIMVLRFLVQWVETNKSERNSAFLSNAEVEFQS
jgi:lipid-A-disaccharide synthase-like uncharacterized protein